MSGGSFAIFFQRPIALVLLAISVILLGLAGWGMVVARRDWRAKLAAAEAGK
jgi:TctA family transporter